MLLTSYAVSLFFHVTLHVGCPFIANRGVEASPLKLVGQAEFGLRFLD